MSAARLRELAERIDANMARVDTDHDTHISWCSGCDGPGARLGRGEVIKHRPDCVWMLVDAALASNIAPDLTPRDHGEQ